jgi:dTDP-4-dehydrorhamnose reductase
MRAEIPSLAPESLLSKPRVLLTGSSGFLGSHLAPALAARGAEVVTAGRSGEQVRLDLAEPGSARAALAAARCDFVLHAAAMAAQAACENDPERALQVNCTSAVELLRAAPRWLFVSTDLVFDGTQPPYDETSRPCPISVYGRTKAAAEERLLALGGGRGLVVRLPLLFGRSPTGDRGATDMIRAAARSGQTVKLFTDEYRTPLHAADAARALATLLLATPAEGLLHLPGPETMSRYEFGRRFVALAGLPPSCIAPALRADLPGPPRPADLTMGTVSGWNP